MIKSSEIRKKYLEFFKEKNHAIIPSAPLVPENDPTVLFNVAGMQPIVNYLLGEKHPLGKRLTDVQKCIRTIDIDEVGDDSHLSFFEMLGNWSLGDYFKKESIPRSFEFLVDRLKINPKKLAISVFEGDFNAPRDNESAEIWEKIGIAKHKISFLPKSENWWGPAGETGPCGPDTEIFYWIGKNEFPPENSNVKDDGNNWMEIWNNVFMEYNMKIDGISKLSKPNVDTGMGLERITTILNNKKSVYDTDIFENIISSLEDLFKVSYEENLRAIRIIADHIRTSVMLLSDGVIPSNTEQGYILRRMIRRAVRQGHSLNFKGQFMPKIAEVVIDDFKDVYPSVGENRKIILDEIDREEKQFLKTLDRGLKEFKKVLLEIKKDSSGISFQKTISGEKAFKLYDTYGFPLEMTIEIAGERGFKVDEDAFKKAYEKHQIRSRFGAEQKFKGGLADNSKSTTALHSAAHLLLAGLRKYLGDDVHQKGCNITTERIRFDFNYPEKVEKGILDKIEAYVNEAINSFLVVSVEQINKKEAMESGVEGSFWEKYPDVVSVYSMIGGNGKVYSRELCGGPHVKNSRDMGVFKIQKEESSSRGVRRVKAVLEK